jgi:hypothetical protein
MKQQKQTAGILEISIFNNLELFPFYIQSFECRQFQSKYSRRSAFGPGQ